MDQTTESLFLCCKKQQSKQNKIIHNNIRKLNNHFSALRNIFGYLGIDKIKEM